MTKWLSSIESRLYFFENAVCSLSLIVMLLTVTLGACVRIFNWPIPNVAEWALVAMSPLTFVGSAMCTRVGAHISVDIIDQISSRLIRRLAQTLVAVLTLAFSIIYAWLGWSLFEDALSTKERWLDMGTPIFIPVFFFFAGMVCMAIHGFCNIFRQFIGGSPDAGLVMEATP